ncbi:hypothetical protein AURDEDRAFT_187059 [Auricularia subglabra TFB-10046 SS5]|nr:hypothetical protein AURDEDRAFT_187059 [Auricularia subglabra TFB-10046 SS5]
MSSGGYPPPIQLIKDPDSSTSARLVVEWAERSLPPSFLEQAAQPHVIPGERHLLDALLDACCGPRRLDLFTLVPLPQTTVARARALANVRRLKLCRAEVMDSATLEQLLSHMPHLRELHLIILGKDASQAPSAQTIVGRPAGELELYRMHSVFACSVLPLRYSFNTLRRLDITFRMFDDAVARDALIGALRAARFRRLRHLSLDIRDHQMPEAVAAGLLAACPAVRVLELQIWHVAAYDLLGVMLRACPRALQRLVVVATSSPSRRELAMVETLARCLDPTAPWIPALRELALTTFFRARDADVAPLVDICRTRRIVFNLQGGG